MAADGRILLKWIIRRLDLMVFITLTECSEFGLKGEEFL
jgi:hypothetical protein